MTAEVVGQAARLAEFRARRPWIQITPPLEDGLPWRASWLTPVERGGAEEVRRDDDKTLLDYLEGRFGR